MKQLQSKQQQELIKPYSHSDDQFYYIVSPDHIRNYIDTVDPDSPDTPPDPNPKPDPKPTPDDGDNDSAEKKLVIYHEIDNKKKDAGKFKSEILVKHQYQMKQASDDLKFKQKDF
jgi:hypothetical protein